MAVSLQLYVHDRSLQVPAVLLPGSRAPRLVSESLSVHMFAAAPDVASIPFGGCRADIQSRLQ